MGSDKNIPARSCGSISCRDGSRLLSFCDRLVRDRVWYERLQRHCVLPHDNNTVAGVCHARGINADLPVQWLLHLKVADLEDSMSAVNNGWSVAGPSAVAPIG